MHSGGGKDKEHHHSEGEHHADDALRRREAEHALGEVSVRSGDVFERLDEEPTKVRKVQQEDGCRCENVVLRAAVRTGRQRPDKYGKGGEEGGDKAEEVTLCRDEDQPASQNRTLRQLDGRPVVALRLRQGHSRHSERRVAVKQTMRALP